ncbi:FecR family protein [Parapedobacter sp. GCM10030251]|uniref:FecR family protein n=1 Tax=Parapedobacter sp. GCM10030251 TaxID=3273419 RepID=UPI00361E7AC8
MDNARLLLLIDRALTGTISAVERDELQALLADVSDEDTVIQVLEDRWKLFEPKTSVFSKEEGQEILQRILDGSGNKRPSDRAMRKLSPWFKAVAVILLSAAVWGMIGFYFDDCESNELTIEQAVAQSRIEPGSDKAMIVLANGKAVALGKSNTGLLSKKGKVYVYNSADGRILYEIHSDRVTGDPYHTVKIPKGGHYHIALEDGTKIHLNAESSLRFPIRFTNKRREVELRGEGLFEVAADAERPFLVKTPFQTIRVLGTTFNIHAYPELGKMKTTLVEGTVEVLQKDRVTALRPGEAAVSRHGQPEVHIKKADIDKDLAWHNDYFLFDNEDIVSIMDRVARWYDIEVNYKGTFENIRLGGIFQRSKSIVQLLESFEATGLVKFTIEGRRITVIDKAMIR